MTWTPVRYGFAAFGIASAALAGIAGIVIWVVNRTMDRASRW